MISGLYQIIKYRMKKIKYRNKYKNINITLNINNNYYIKNK